MNRAQILKELKDILRQIEGHDDNVIDAATEETPLRTQLGLNSIGMLYIMIVIEEKFSVSFENATMDSFKRLGDVVDFIEKESL